MRYARGKNSQGLPRWWCKLLTKAACRDTTPGGMCRSPRFQNAKRSRAHARNTKKRARRSGCFSEWWRSSLCIKFLDHLAQARISRKRLGGSNQAAALGTFDKASPETRANPMGSYLFRGHPYITHRCSSSFLRSAGSIAWAHRLDDAVGDGGDVGDGSELRAHGHRISVSGFGLYVHQPRNESPYWIYRGLGHVSRISFSTGAKRTVCGVSDSAD